MFNTHKIILNYDKSLGEFNAPLIHRTGDLKGLTIVATIKRGIDVPAVILNPILVMNFDNGSQLNFNCTSINNIITITLSNNLNGNLGVARCYFKDRNGNTTNNFKIVCISTIEFTDSDLTWKHLDFSGKVSGDLNSNPNIISQYKRRQAWVGGSDNNSVLYMSQDDLAEDSYSLEMSQEIYDAQKNFLYDIYDSTDSKLISSNYLNGSKANPEQIPLYILGTDTLAGRQGYEYDVYPIVTRFKVPSSISKIRINSLFTNTQDYYDRDNIINGDTQPHMTKGAKIKALSETFVSVWQEDGTSRDVRLTDGKYLFNYSNLFKDYHRQIRDTDGFKSLENDTRSLYNTQFMAKKVEIDCTKNNVIDNYGYLDIIQNDFLSTSDGVGKLLWKRRVYPQINIDYAYLDLS